MQRKWTYGAALFMAALLHAAPAASQSYPSRPVRIVVPSAPGGGTDVAARALAPQLARAWSVQVLVDNRPSPAANIAAEAVAKAPPDGYTLLLTTSALAINPAVTLKLGYATNDFVPVGAVMSAPHVLLVQPSLQVKSVKELVALAKAQPDKLRYGHSGSGSADHLCGELFKKAAGIRVTAVTYKNAIQPGEPMLIPEIQYAFAGVVHAIPHIKAGQASPLAVTTARRYPLLPNLPAVHETLPGFEFAGWQALFAPARTPPAVLRQLEVAVFKAMDSKEMSERLATQGLQPISVTPEELRTFLPQQIARWGTLVREANVRLE